MSEAQPGPDLADKSAVSCSFCRKGYLDAGPLVQGPDVGNVHVYICGKCSEVVVSLFEAAKRGREDKSTEAAGPSG